MFNNLMTQLRIDCGYMHKLLPADLQEKGEARFKKLNNLEFAAQMHASYGHRLRGWWYGGRHFWKLLTYRHHYQAATAYPTTSRADV